ncbi:DUF4258 domain-containing protein [Flavobacterium sp.]|uniref:DUF4258 domain-containing protein n=1 Tax=Flavobacterium sp. TaxID=239 RepID=UPI0028BED7DA|nr:DUF4258 domain-containing protein [Flavobacterium sp.]
MKFTQRLAYYLLGLLLGGIFVYFFFQKKKTEFCYLPNCRVLKDLRSKPISIAPEAQQKLNEKWVTMEDIKACLQHGDVDFSQSNKPAENGKLYIVEGYNTKHEEIEVTMINYTERVVLKDIKKQ